MSLSHEEKLKELDLQEEELLQVEMSHKLLKIIIYILYPLFIVSIIILLIFSILLYNDENLPGNFSFLIQSIIITILNIVLLFILFTQHKAYQNFQNKKYLLIFFLIHSINLISLFILILSGIVYAIKGHQKMHKDLINSLILTYLILGIASFLLALFLTIAENYGFHLISKKGKIEDGITDNEYRLFYASESISLPLNSTNTINDPFTVRLERTKAKISDLSKKRKKMRMIVLTMTGVEIVIQIILNIMMIVDGPPWNAKQFILFFVYAVFPLVMGLGLITQFSTLRKMIVFMLFCWAYVITCYVGVALYSLITYAQDPGLGNTVNIVVFSLAVSSNSLVLTMSVFLHMYAYYSLKRIRLQNYQPQLSLSLRHN